MDPSYIEILELFMFFYVTLILTSWYDNKIKFL